MVKRAQNSLGRFQIQGGIAIMLKDDKTEKAIISTMPEGFKEACFSGGKDINGEVGELAGPNL